MLPPKLMNAVKWFILPMVFIITCFMYNAGIGFLALIAYFAVTFYVKRTSIFMQMGTLRYAKRDLDGTLKWYKRAYATGQTKPKSVISYAYVQLKAGNPEKADDILKLLLTKKLDKDERYLARTIQSLIVWKNGDLDESIRMLEEIIPEYKTTVIYGNMGFFLNLKGDLEKALALNLEAYEYLSTNTAIADNLGKTYYMLGEYDKADEIYEKLMKSNPDMMDAHYNHGLVLLKKGRMQEALDSFMKADIYKLNFLSTITKEDIQARIAEAEASVEQKKLEESGSNPV